MIFHACEIVVELYNSSKFSLIFPAHVSYLESCIKIRINLNLYFLTSLWCLWGAFKAFIKPFEVPQKKCVNKKLTFSLRPESGQEGLTAI